MEKKIIIAGSGGQGILFLGRMLLSAAMREGRDVTWFPAYGAEMRGGTANCTVIISDEMIGSPVVTTPDILIAMTRASLDRFLPSLRNKGMLLYDSSLINEKISRRNVIAVAVPCTRIAGDMDCKTSANMVMLGALMANTGLLKPETILSLFGDTACPKKAGSFPANKELFQRGLDCIENT